jgi:hypothetical protein
MYRPTGNRKPYAERTTPDQAQIIKEWENARRRLGSRKVLAARIGVTLPALDYQIRKLKGRGSNEE